MNDRLTEIQIVLGYSWRTRWCLYTGIVFAVLIQVLGRWLIDDFELTGPYAALTEVIQAALWERYTIASLVILGSSIATAIPLYRSDRKRLFQL